MFWLGMMAQLWIAMKWLLLPPSSAYDVGHEGELGNFLLHMIMPWSVLTLSLLAGYIKFLRTGLLEVLPMDFIRTARGKGASQRRVVWRHAMRNAVLPMITVIGTDFPTIVANAGLVGMVFNLGNLATNLYWKIQTHDYPSVAAMFLIVSVIAVALNWLVDIIYMWVDPRIRYS